ncbi:hypothetical protein MAR_016452 [Mya arenaria]|uniref:Uncharacterized protein n=1 Tax=Mya arenaria TaxID=6604 RepID=A0ABY7FP68_MYAAR|nr:hypothetical protein MAR_016452 [Mya arenaria]
MGNWLQRSTTESSSGYGSVSNSVIRDGTHDASSHERKACTRQLKVVSEPTNCDKTSLSAINEHVTDLRESVIFPELKHLDKRVNLGRFSFDSPQFSKQGKHVPEESVTRRVLENALEKTGQPGTKDESRDSAYESIRSDNHSIHEVRSDVYKLVMKKERI